MVKNKQCSLAEQDRSLYFHGRPWAMQSNCRLTDKNASESWDRKWLGERAGWESTNANHRQDCSTFASSIYLAFIWRDLATTSTFTTLADVPFGSRYLYDCTNKYHWSKRFRLIFDWVQSNCYLSLFVDCYSGKYCWMKSTCIKRYWWNYLFSFSTIFVKWPPRQLFCWDFSNWSDSEV